MKHVSAKLRNCLQSNCNSKRTISRLHWQQC